MKIALFLVLAFILLNQTSAMRFTRGFKSTNERCQYSRECAPGLYCYGLCPPMFHCVRETAAFPACRTRGDVRLD
ncbi:unnamed protein product, partial [Mesorhabditis spiculigera]